MKFGDIVCVKDVQPHESHYEGIYGVVVAVEEEDVSVFFQGDYEPETRDIDELMIIKELKL